MTDPECHEARRDVVAFVTGAQQGESSSATCSSSGASGCNTDDDGSTDSEDDDDDGFGSSESLSPDKRWTTADGYNMTTFDQTECGTWAIDQPLPLPLWAKESKPALVIDKVSPERRFQRLWLLISLVHSSTRMKVSLPSLKHRCST